MHFTKKAGRREDDLQESNQPVSLKTEGNSSTGREFAMKKGGKMQNRGIQEEKTGNRGVFRKRKREKNKNPKARKVGEGE